jgi:hypothetical protein
VSKTFEGIDDKLAGWIEQQSLFFVATAPLAADGHVNLSPKGLESFVVLGPRSVAYLDLTGSGVETIAHLNENGRIVVMFCAFSGPPRIVRLHGHGTPFPIGTPEYAELAPNFKDYPGARSIIRIELDRVSDSCGFAVPRMQLEGDRDDLLKWAERKGPDGLETYWADKNAASLDGLPGI